MMKIISKSIFVFILLLSTSITKAEFTAPDLIVEDLNCKPIYLDENKSRLFRYEERFIELPDSDDQPEEAEFIRVQNAWNEFRGQSKYFLYDVKDTTYFIRSNNILDENNNQIIDQVENQKVGELGYVCDVTIKNIGADILNEDTVFFEFYIKMNDDFYLIHQSTHWDGSFDIANLKKGDTYTFQTEYEFKPNFLNGQKVSDFNLDYYSKRPYHNFEGIPLGDKLELKLLLNAKPEPPMFPNYMNQTLGRSIYKNQSEELLLSADRFKEINYLNNQYDYTIDLPEFLYPNQIPEFTVDIDEENQKFVINWNKVPNADSYKMRLYYNFTQTLLPTADKMQEVQFDKDTTQYVIDYSKMNYQESIGVSLKAINQFGETYAEQQTLQIPIQPFTDVSKDAWYYESLIKAFRRGKIKGYPGPLNSQGVQTKLFRPNQSVTKAEALHIVSLGNYHSYSKDSVPFQYRNKWYAQMLAFLIDNDFSIIQKSYNLDEKITRAELVTFIMEIRYFLNDDTKNIFLNNPQVDQLFNYKFPDVTKLPDKKYIQFAYDMQIINGNSNGLFKPNATLNRAEAVQIMHNLFGSRFRG